MFTRKEAESSNTDSYVPTTSRPPIPDRPGKTASSPATTGSKASDISHISKGTRIQGDLYSENDIRIDGEVKGVVRCRSKVVIGQTGFVDGDVECVQGEIIGRIKGSLKVQDHLFLRGDAKIEGDVLTTHLEMEPSVKFNGKCTMQDKVELSSMTPREEKPAAQPVIASTSASNTGGITKPNGEKESKIPGTGFQK